MTDLGFVEKEGFKPMWLNSEPVSKSYSVLEGETLGALSHDSFRDELLTNISCKGQCTQLMRTSENNWQRDRIKFSQQ